MKTFILVLLSFFLVNLALFANPFIGKWTADSVTVVFDESTLVVTVDSEDPDLAPLRGTYSYTYDGAVLRVGDFVAIYAFSPDSTKVIIMCFLGEGSISARMRFTKVELPSFKLQSYKS